MARNEAPDIIDVHIGHRLRDMRTSQRMSMLALGKQVSVSYQQVQKYETGADRLSASTLWRIASVLRVDVAYFFQGLDDSLIPLLPDADSIRAATAIGRMEPAVAREIRGLINSLASATP